MMYWIWTDVNSVKRNIEIKAVVENIDILAVKVASITEEEPLEIIQDDIFFRCETGRWKLRFFSDGTGELIFYRRQNNLAPKESCYQRTATITPDVLLDILSSAYGQTGRVKKHRTVYKIGKTRIHLDKVEGLGDFVELEVVLADGEAAEVGINEIQALMSRLGVTQEELIEGAYVDLLAKKCCSVFLYLSTDQNSLCIYSK